MSDRLEETVTLSQAKELIQCLAVEESLLLLSPPGVGKSETVAQAAAEAGLPCRSLLGTQIAPEDVSGVPRIVGERSVFCPPRVLLPESDEPFCLFLDELPACTPDIQKAFYSLLLERRIGEHRLPPGSWVVAAGNRATDRALVRTISSALVNRVIVLHVRVDESEWRLWARQNQVRSDVLEFIEEHPEALMRPVPAEPVPFSTPRSWTLLSQALDELAAAKVLPPLAILLDDLSRAPSLLDESVCRAVAAGRVSAEDAARFAVWWTIRQHARVDVTRTGLRGLLNMGVFELGLSQATALILQEGGLTIVRDLVVRMPKELQSQCRLIDAGRLEEIADRLGAYGLRPGMDLTGVPTD
jgi:MoxR-like ATPase